MTDRIALVLGILIALVFVIDALAFGGSLPLFLGRRLAGLIEYLAFWR
ncbi:hypothetical protein [Frigidibacter oleivorans]|nr:hypothetical protein [Frigidibacter oleivorans]